MWLGIQDKMSRGWGIWNWGPAFRAQDLGSMDSRVQDIAIKGFGLPNPQQKDLTTTV